MCIFTLEGQDKLVIAALRKFLPISDGDGENLAYSGDLMLPANAIRDFPKHQHYHRAHHVDA